ncbi:hypothetical protein [Limnohabitans sp. 2KL-3]|nr:hypothetical protein [Limnohabitans sp. 2KL-3]
MQHINLSYSWTPHQAQADVLVKHREHSARQSLHLDMRFRGSVDAIRA